MVKITRLTDRKGWVPLDNGYERTCAPEIIDSIVTRLTERRHPVCLAHNKTKLGFSFIFERNGDQLSIDRPKECPENLKELRVIFKDEAKLANQFSCRITSTTEDAFYARIPDTLFRLQRRSSFRVDAPQGSYVSFNVKDQRLTGMPIKNISASGMLFCSKKNYQLIDSVLADITLAMPTRESDDPMTDWELKKVEQGRVVRFFHDKSNGSLCFGVNFVPKPQQENELIRYIRQRELELLRKGLCF